MAQLQAADLADLVKVTLNELGEMKFSDIMSDYQNTIALKRIMRKHKMTFDAGPEVEFNFMFDTGRSARFVGLGAIDIVDITPVMDKGKVPYRHVTWNWAVERREIAMNRSPRKIVDIVKTRRISEFGAAVKLFEQRFWRCPAASDNVNPYGVPYWIVKSNTAATTNDGFNGTLPSGYTTVANISPTTYPRWANYATQYTLVTKDDLIRKARAMAWFTDFEPLVDDIPTYNTGDDLAYYTNYALLSQLEELLEAQNDNLGNDVASMDGKTMLRRVPVVAVKELNLDTTNPLYQINWGEFKAMGLRGEWMHETVEPQVSGQHTMAATHTDCSFNWFVRDRRRNGVLATNTTMPA